MTDFHVHIGQFDAVYYYADRVFSSLASCGTDELWFPSTTSCVYFKEWPELKDKDDLRSCAPTAKDLYEGIYGEVRNDGAAVGALLWRR